MINYARLLIYLIIKDLSKGLLLLSFSLLILATVYLAYNNPSLNFELSNKLVTKSKLLSEDKLAKAKEKNTKDKIYERLAKLTSDTNKRPY